MPLSIEELLKRNLTSVCMKDEACVFRLNLKCVFSVKCQQHMNHGTSGPFQWSHISACSPAYTFQQAVSDGVKHNFHLIILNMLTCTSFFFPTRVTGRASNFITFWVTKLTCTSCIV